MPTDRPKSSPLAAPSRVVYLSLGSNLGDSQGMIRKALKQFTPAGVELVRASSLYKTEPVDFIDQPWFINGVVKVKTALSARKLLRALKSIEKSLGRKRVKAKGPRLIDIDILLYENVVVNSTGLTIPHPRMTERRFVLVPLKAIAPRVVHPVNGLTVSEMLRKTSDASRVIRLREK